MASKDLAYTLLLRANQELEHDHAEQIEVCVALLTVAATYMRLTNTETLN
jgi:hypothetical protein